MPLVDIHLIEGVFDKNQKQAMNQQGHECHGRSGRRSYARRYLGPRV